MENSRLKAVDLMAVLNSFKPQDGTIISVAIYLSDFGHERVEEEKAKGPQLSSWRRWMPRSTPPTISTSKL